MKKLMIILAILTVGVCADYDECKQEVKGYIAKYGKENIRFSTDYIYLKRLPGITDNQSYVGGVQNSHYLDYYDISNTLGYMDYDNKFDNREADMLDNMSVDFVARIGASGIYDPHAEILLQKLDYAIEAFEALDRTKKACENTKRFKVTNAYKTEDIKILKRFKQRVINALKREKTKQETEVSEFLK